MSQHTKEGAQDAWLTVGSQALVNCFYMYTVQYCYLHVIEFSLPIFLNHKTAFNLQALQRDCSTLYVPYSPYQYCSKTFIYILTYLNLSQSMYALLMSSQRVIYFFFFFFFPRSVRENIKSTEKSRMLGCTTDSE